MWRSFFSKNVLSLLATTKAKKREIKKTKLLLRTSKGNVCVFCLEDTLFLQVQELNSPMPTVCLHTAVKWENFVMITESWGWKKLNGSFTLSSRPEAEPTVVASWLTNGCLAHPGIYHVTDLVSCLLIRHITILTCPKSSPNLVYYNLSIKFCSTPSLGGTQRELTLQRCAARQEDCYQGPVSPL